MPATRSSLESFARTRMIVAVDTLAKYTLDAASTATPCTNGVVAVDANSDEMVPFADTARMVCVRVRGTHA